MEKKGDSKTEKDSISTTTRGENEQLIINTVDIRKENESLYNSALHELREDNHTRVMEILNYFIENDLYLRRIIADQFNPFGFISLKIIIELQSYYNFFRITLLSDVVNYLVLSYNQVKKYIKSDYDLAFEWYKYAETLNEVYIYDINTILRQTKKVAPDEHQVKIYNEVVDAFEEVKKIGIQNIQVLMRQTLKNVTKPGTLRF